MRLFAATVVLVLILLATSAAWAGGRGDRHHHHRDYGREGAAVVLGTMVGVLLADRLQEREHGHHHQAPHHVHHHYWGVPSRSTCNEWIMQRSSAAYRQEWARVRKYDDRIRAWCAER